MSTLASIAAYLAAGIAPGWALVRWLEVGRNGLERGVLAAAIGPLLLAGATLLATATVGGGVLVLWTPLACGLAATSEWRARAREPASPRAERLGAGLWLPALAGGIALVYAGVGRSGVTLDSGALVFLGRDASFDPLVYLSIARHLAEVGLPLTHPLVGGIEITGSYVPFATLAGLHLATGAPWLDLIFRAIPLANVLGVGLAAVALARALGAPTRAAALSGVVVLLASGADFLLDPRGSGEGPWAFFGPYLLPFNPIGPGLTTWLAACLLLATADSRGRKSAVLAGALLGALFEIKVFLWLPAVLAVGLTALRPGRPEVRSVWRWAAATAALVSAPSVVEKLLWAARLEGVYETGLRLCLGCVPRYIAASSADAAAGFDAFRGFRNLDLLSPQILVETVGAIALVTSFGLGARWVGVPELWRRARGGDPVARYLGAAALLGLALSATLTIRPHSLNGAQFAFPATFGLSLFSAIALERWWRVRSTALATLLAPLVLALLVGGSVRILAGPLGLGAPTSLVVTAGERALLEALEAASRPTDVVLEPTALEDDLRPSPIAWLAGRAVYFNHRPAGEMLPGDGMARRAELLARAFTPGAAAEVRAALEESGAQWVYAPAHRPLGHPLAEELEPLLRTPAGSVSRVVRHGRGVRDGRDASPPEALRVEASDAWTDPDGILLRSVALELSNKQRELFRVGTQCPCRTPAVVDVPQPRPASLRFSVRTGTPLLAPDSPSRGTFSIPLPGDTTKVAIVATVRAGRLELFAYDWNDVEFLEIEPAPGSSDDG